ncbi:MAG TPA: TatD family hydrolase [Bacteroidales bacterium]|nr:TatD family hydrolase [Bacteroidales bacterium]HPS17459.1 TatD family hydrolase [Bacteroidales bacterium]
MILIDSHTHIYLEEFADDVELTVNRAIQNDVKKLILPNIDSTSIKPMFDLCNQFPGICFSCMGLHPGSVNQNYHSEMEIISEWLAKEKFVAIGEIGIDLYWDKTFINEQIEVFKLQLELAKKYNLPVIIHSRNALNEIIQVLNEKNYSDVKAVFHCYPGSLEQAKQLIKNNHLLGIGGVVTYKNSGLAKVVKEIPLENIILETDSPYLPPVPYRGQRNESAYIKTIAEFIATLRNCSVDEVAAITTKNACSFFNIEI